MSFQTFPQNNSKSSNANFSVNSQELAWLRLLKQKDPKAVALELARCKKSPWHFLTRWVVTEDSQDQTSPYKLFPQKPHLRSLSEYWLTEKRLLVPKSRQVSASWLFTALYLWEAIFYPSRMTFFCSKKEQDAEGLCERTHFMVTRLAPFFHDFIQVERTFCMLKFSNRSQIKGIPQGADQIRSYTLSGLLIDEAVYVNELSDMLMASLPAIGRNGRLTIISSAGPSTFSNLTFDVE